MAWFGLRRRGGRHAVRPLMAPPSGVTITPHVYKPSGSPIVVQATTPAEAPFVAGPLAPRVAPTPVPARVAEAVRRPSVPRGLVPEPAVKPISSFAPTSTAVETLAPTTDAPSSSPAPGPKAARKRPAPQLTPARVNPGPTEPVSATVGLFFDDGSHVVLDAADPRASAFKALAERLNT